jgi:hypothetical protein
LRLADLRCLANPYFVGREETLNEIHEKLFTNPTTVLTQGHVAAITALGGVGKTALASSMLRSSGDATADILGGLVQTAFGEIKAMLPQGRIGRRIRESRAIRSDA